VAQTLTAKYTDANGAGDFATASIAITNTANNVLSATYTVATNSVTVGGNAGAGTVTATSSQAGNVLTVVWKVTPSLPLVGANTVSLSAADAEGLSSGSADMTTWNITAAKVINTSLTPNAVTSTDGIAQQFVSAFTDINGAGDITGATISITNGAKTLSATYNVATGIVALGGNGTAGATVTATSTVNGNQRNVAWTITPGPVMDGNNTVSIMATGAEGNNSTLTNFGTWQINPSAPLLAPAPLHPNNPATTKPSGHPTSPPGQQKTAPTFARRGWEPLFVPVVGKLRALGHTALDRGR
jgi:hypothetical protein